MISFLITWAIFFHADASDVFQLQLLIASYLLNADIYTMNNILYNLQLQYS